MKLIADKQATKNINTIKIQGAKRDVMIHETAMWAIYHANQGQVTPMNKLLGALNKSDRKEALKVYFRDFSKVSFNKLGVAEYSKAKQLYIAGKEVSPDECIEYADAHPFYDYTHEVKPATSVDALKRLTSLITQLDEFTGEVKHLEVLTLLKEAKAKAIELTTPKVQQPKTTKA